MVLILWLTFFILKLANLLTINLKLIQITNQNTLKLKEWITSGIIVSIRNRETIL